MPRTIVAADAARIRSFVESVGGRAILKPVDGHGGSSVFALASGDGNYNALVETLTAGGTQLAIVQAFVPEVTQGDKRILLLEGEPLGAILRVPRPDDVRSNIHVGGRVVSTELTERDLAICARIGPKLREDGLFFVGIDVIGGLLTEVNVTSPTGIQQMSRLCDENFPARVISGLVRRIAAFPP
jgi:glutathione synthase